MGTSIEFVGVYGNKKILKTLCKVEDVYTGLGMDTLMDEAGKGAAEDGDEWMEDVFGGANPPPGLYTSSALSLYHCNRYGVLLLRLSLYSLHKDSLALGFWLPCAQANKGAISLAMALVIEAMQLSTYMLTC